MECLVKVFPMRADELLDIWPEAEQRRRGWFTLPQAACTSKTEDLQPCF